MFKEYDNGFYDGEVQDEQRHGRGKYTWNDGRSYDGEWKNDKLHGEGIFIFTDGGKYIGKFKDNREAGGWRHSPDGSKKWVFVDAEGRCVESIEPPELETQVAYAGASSSASCPRCGAKEVFSGTQTCPSCLKEGGHAHARRGQWQEAASDYAAVLASAPNDQWNGLLLAMLLASLLVEIGDSEGYEKHRRMMLEHFVKPDSPYVAEQIAKSSLIMPVNDPELAHAGRLADVAVAADEKNPGISYFQFAKGLAEYRAGRFESAVDCEGKVLGKMGVDDRRDVQAHMVLAMACCQLGRLDEARAALEKGSDIAGAKLPQMEGGDIGDNWHDWIIAHALMREAKSLINEANRSASLNAQAEERKRVLDSNDPVALKALADQGDAEAAFSLGRMFQYGTGVAKSHAYSLKWYLKAADGGHSEGQNSSGFMYQNGLGIEKNYTEALKWYRKAAEAGNSTGQSNLGTMYRDSLGLEKNYAEAIKWFRKAAEAGNSAAQCNLGNMLADGLGVEKTYAEATKWFRKAAEAEYPEGQNCLGFMYLNGFGVEQNYREAFNWFRKAAEADYSIGQCNLGTMYRYGLGVPPNQPEALKWYRKAAEVGNSDAQKNLEAGAFWRNYETIRGYR